MHYEYRILSAAGSALSRNPLDLQPLEAQINNAAQEGFRVCQMSTHAKPAGATGGRVPESHHDVTGIVVILERESPSI